MRRWRARARPPGFAGFDTSEPTVDTPCASPNAPTATRNHRQEPAQTLKRATRPPPPDLHRCREPRFLVPRASLGGRLSTLPPRLLGGPRWRRYISRRSPGTSKASRRASRILRTFTPNSAKRCMGTLSPPVIIASSTCASSMDSNSPSRSASTLARVGNTPLETYNFGW